MLDRLARWYRYALGRQTPLDRMVTTILAHSPLLWYGLRNPLLAVVRQVYPSFLIDGMPGVRIYSHGRRILLYLTPVTILLCITAGSTTTLPLLTLTLLPVLIGAFGFYCLADGSHQWFRSTRQHLSTRTVTMLYQLLINAPHDSALRDILRASVNDSRLISNSSYLDLLPDLIEHLYEHPHLQYHAPISFLVDPWLACLSELGLNLDPCRYYQYPSGANGPRPLNLGLLMSLTSLKFVTPEATQLRHTIAAPMIPFIPLRQPPTSAWIQRTPLIQHSTNLHTAPLNQGHVKRPITHPTWHTSQGGPL